MSKLPDTIRFSGRILFLTEDPDLLRKQLDGEDLDWDPDRKLIDNISTDEITPGWVCYFYDETLGRYSLVGLRGKVIKKDDLRDGGFDVIVSGLSKGCGSSRETAPYSEKYAGIRLVIAKTIEKIYHQNCQNIGLLTSTDTSLIPRILAGEEIPVEEFTEGLDPISRDIVLYGGLSAYNRKRLAGGVRAPKLETKPRPMNVVEKIIARHAVVDAKEGILGVEAVKPGDSLFCRTDVRFSHEYVTPMAEAIFVRAFGEDAKVRDPENVYAFRDHLTFLGEVMSEERKEMGLLEKAEGLAKTQQSFTRRQGIRLYGEVAEGGSEAICHNAVLEDIALPGQLIIGTDSHTCTAGALGCFAFGVGSTDMANAWYTKDIRVKVPEVVRYVLEGTLPPDVAAKDVMLAVMATDYIREGKAIGQVLQFEGPVLDGMVLDERATLTNMAVEAGASTGIIEPDEEVIRYLAAERGLAPEKVKEMFCHADEGAEYAETFTLDVSSLRPMVATPGDPRNGILIKDLGESVRIDIAYAGSCTGGKKTDMDQYARVFRVAREQGRRVPDHVKCYLQFGSQKIRKYAEEKGYVELFESVGAQLVAPSCGACINSGPGVSTSEEQITISAINRNFPGRSGPGSVYLASPMTVAASAIEGKIVEPAVFLGEPQVA